MKRLHICLLILFLPLFLLAGEKTNITDLFVESTEFPFKIHSGYVNDALEGDFNELTAQDLKALSLDVASNNYDGKGVIKTLLEIDSLKKANVPLEEIQSKYWEFYAYSMVATNKITLNSGITACIWIVHTEDMNQSWDHLFITLCKKDKPYFYFTLPVSNSYSDSPVWTNKTINSRITKDGNIFVDGYIEDGEYNDADGTEYIDKRRQIIELQIKNNGVEELLSEYIEMSGEPNADEKPAVYSSFDAITIGDGLKMRTWPSTNDDVICRYNTGELVRIIDITDEKEVLMHRDECDKYGFPWYRIEDNRRYAGWVYGKFVYKINKADEDSKIFGKKYRLGENVYTFNFATDLSYGSKDERAANNCQIFYLPYFYKDGKKVLPVHYNKETFPDNDLSWRSDQYDGGLIYLLAENGNGSDRISELNETEYQGNPALEMVINTRDNGSSKTKIYITDVNGKMEVAGIEHSPK